MKKGLVLGKFMPLHAGHIALINFASERCDELIVIICAEDSESLPGETRLNWIREVFKSNAKVQPRVLFYNKTDLPNTSESSVETSFIWAEYLKQHIGKVDTFFSSEPYGAYMGKFMACDHKFFDIGRFQIPVSATQIRSNPFKYWKYIPKVVQPFYVKKICLYGTESTGKSTLAKRLAQFFDTEYVPEMAREILENTNECKPYHLQQIGSHHAKAIIQKVQIANKLLFVDTDINITRSYSRFLFSEELEIPKWIIEANEFDLYFYLDKNAPYIQDGTRLNEADRNRLDTFHRKELFQRDINYHLLQGNWDERFDKAVQVIKNRFKV